MCICIYIHTYIYIYVCVCVCLCKYTGLEIGGVASQNANHFWGNCESLWQSESQNCESLLNDLRITFQMVSQKHLLFVFFGPHPFLGKISPFVVTFYVYDTKMRIRCEL